VKNTRQDFDLIRLLPLGGEARRARPPQIEERLDVTFFEGDEGWTAIDDTADRGTMAFAKSREPEEMTKAVVGHGWLSPSP
jgi:hypothetical protein